MKSIRKRQIARSWFHDLDPVGVDVVLGPKGAAEDMTVIDFRRMGPPFVLLLLSLSAPGFFHTVQAEEGIKEGAKEVGKGFKEIGKATGEAAREVGKTTGEIAKKGGKAIGKGFKEAGKATGKAFKEMGKEVKEAVTK